MWVVEFPASKSGDLGLEAAILGLYQEKFEIMVQRHRKYGPNNIAAGGRSGILVRQEDKKARILRGGPPMGHGDDSKDDALIDHANYGDILALWERGDWPRPEQQQHCESCGREL